MTVKYNKNVYQALTMITQFGINMLVPIFICTFVGILLDKKLGTSWITVVLFFVGALAGFTNVFRFAKQIYSQPAVTRKRRTDHKGKKDEEN
jgi:F0F1-type ATP synthase assembly protein I